MADSLLGGTQGRALACRYNRGSRAVSSRDGAVGLFVSDCCCARWLLLASARSGTVRVGCAEEFVADMVKFGVEVCIGNGGSKL
jgi:hypothetical protein